MHSDVEHLAPRLARGDEHAYRELVQTLGEPLFRYAFSILRDPDAAEDAVQTCLIRLHRNRKRLREGSLKSYAYRITRNVARTRVRDSALRNQRENESNGGGTHESPELAAMAREAWSLAQQLPGDIRDAVLLHVGHGLTLNETADALEVPRGTVSTRVRKGLEELRGKLAIAPALLPALPELQGAMAATQATPVTPPSALLTRLETKLMATVTAKSTATGGILAACLLLLLLAGTVSIAAADPFSWFNASEHNNTADAPAPIAQSDTGVDADGASGSDAALGNGTDPGLLNGSANGAGTDNKSNNGGSDAGTGSENGANTPNNGSGTGNEAVVDEPNEEPEEDPPFDFASRSVEISGIVLDSEGQYVAGSAVSAVSPWDDAVPARRVMAASVSDATGAFFLTFNLANYAPSVDDARQSDIRSFHCTLLVLAGLDGREATVRIDGNWTPDASPQVFRNVVLVLSETHALEVHVSNNQGTPLAAQVALVDVSYSPIEVHRAPSGKALQTRADENGIARLDLPTSTEEDPWFSINRVFDCLHVSLDGYESRLVPFDVGPVAKPGTTRVDVRLEAGRQVVVKFTDPLNRPVSSQPFQIELPEDNGLLDFENGRTPGQTEPWMPAPNAPSAATDEHGLFTARNLPPNEVAFYADFDTTRPNLRGCRVLIPAGATEVAVVVSRFVEVSVTDEQGRTIRAEFSNMFNAESGQKIAWRSIYMGRGKFGLVLPREHDFETPIEYLIRVTVDGWFCDAFGKATFSGAEDELSLTVKPTEENTVTVRLLLAGDVYRVYLESADDDEHINLRTPYETSFHHVPPGEYTVRMVTQNRGEISRQINVLAEPELQHFDLSRDGPTSGVFRSVGFNAPVSPVHAKWRHQLHYEAHFQPGSTSFERDWDKRSSAHVPTGAVDKSGVILERLPKQECVVVMSTQFFKPGPGRHPGLEVTVHEGADENSQIDVPSVNWVSATINLEGEDAPDECWVSLVRLGDGLGDEISAGDLALLRSGSWTILDEIRVTDGRLEVPAIALGRYAVIVREPGEEDRVGLITVAGDGQAHTAVLTP